MSSRTPTTTAAQIVHSDSADHGAGATGGDRDFYSTLFLTFGPLSAALGWLAFNSVGAVLVLGGVAATLVGAGLRPNRTRVLVARLGITLGLWPITVRTPLAWLI